MDLLIDTHILIWLVVGDRRLGMAQREALADVDNRLIVNAAIAYEVTHLQSVGRIPIEEDIDQLRSLVGFTLVDLPHDCWRFARTLPDHHRDPIDRLLIAHAMASGMTLVTADATIRRYPVATL